MSIIDNLGCAAVRVSQFVHTVATESNGSTGGANRADRRRRLVTIQQTADYLGVVPRTVRNYISNGYFPAYRIPRTRGIRLDLDEVIASMKLVPAARARSGVGSYGPNARIVDLPPQPVAVQAVNVTKAADR